MALLKIGDKVKMSGGGEAVILSEFGSGGQGTVYKALYDGKEYALKWYHEGVFKENAENFYNNIENNISKGSPTNAFLWPLGITERQNGSFGYIMEIRPEEYEELTNFFVSSKKKNQVKFKSFYAISTAAINIINAFRELHNKGYSYQDINNGNFFINPQNGSVLIGDNDNVSPYGTNLGIMGKQRWMAPEIVTGQSNPDKQSDRFSLAVVLFRLLFINHPLEGRYSTPPCMTKELERKYYGTEPVFVYNPNDSRNRPVHGTDYNLKIFWNIYPEYIRQLFIRAFSYEAMHEKNKRVIEKEWLDAFIRLRAETGICPYCKEEMFYNSEGVNSCFECGKKIVRPPSIVFSNITMPLFCGMKIYLWHIDSSLNDVSTIIGEVVTHPKNPNQIGIKNLSDNTWKVNLTDGTTRPLASGNVVPIRNGYTIDFTGNNKFVASIKF